jgi:hypothetical protein
MRNWIPEFKRCCLETISEGENKKSKRKALFKEIIAEIFPQIHKVSEIPNHTKTKKDMMRRKG